MFLSGLTEGHVSKQLINSNRALILYDSSIQVNWLGYLDGLLLANLLGHFDLKYDLLPVEKYKLNDLNNYSTLFYLGVTYNNQLPKDFLYDVLHTNKDIVWFKYNIWQLSENRPDFKSHYGFNFDYVDSSGYEKIIYKNTPLEKNNLDPDLGHVTVTNKSLVKVLSVAKQTITNNTIPYAINSSNFWYFADVPLTFISENDRYLILADLLYDILHIKGVDKKRALLRLEDIDPTYNTETLIKTADYLYSQKIPFAVSVIPYYKDPQGFFTGGIPKFIKITDKPEFIDALKYMESKGGKIILHGYTHQSSDEINTYTSVSGHGYEFFRATFDSETAQISLFEPLAEDSLEWVSERVNSALEILSNADLSTSLWETPHYAASNLDNKYFSEKFLAIVGRVIYFDKNDETHFVGQFYPYVIQHDYYGQKVIPENIGGLSPVSGFNYPIRTVDDMLLSAKNNLVVRDAWASMYFHPYLGIDYLKKLIPAIQTLGYEFVDISPDIA